jgi:hypothetical protein
VDGILYARACLGNVIRFAVLLRCVGEVVRGADGLYFSLVDSEGGEAVGEVVEQAMYRRFSYLQYTPAEVFVVALAPL